MIYTSKAEWRIFDCFDPKGNNLLQVWADELPMQKKDRARLDSKIDMLAQAGGDLPPGLLQNTSSRHILELAVNGDVALRPQLCRGPFNMLGEFTFLMGAVERDRKYVPRDAPQKAEIIRDDLLSNPAKRRDHEQFSAATKEDL